MAEAPKIPGPDALVNMATTQIDATLSLIDTQAKEIASTMGLPALPAPAMKLSTIIPKMGGSTGSSPAGAPAGLPNLPNLLNPQQILAQLPKLPFQLPFMAPTPKGKGSSDEITGKVLADERPRSPLVTVQT